MNGAGHVLARTVGVTRSFGVPPAETEVLKPLDFVLGSGELVLLMGPSGSGKTTLISILVGVLGPSSGRVELFGHDITAMTREQVARVRRRMLGFIFQSDNLFPAVSALENVVEVLRLKGHSRDEAYRLAVASLERVGMEHRLHHLPGELSGGQRQRVAIARAIANAPPLLVGDEITGALDGPTAMKVMADVRTLVTPRTSALLVTHDPRLTQFADRLVRMEDGRVVSDERVRPKQEAS